MLILEQEIYIWFNNNRNKSIVAGQCPSISFSKVPAKHPHAKNAEDIFAEVPEHKVKIVAAMSQKQGKGGATMQNLSEYNHLKKEFFSALPESECTKYGDQASEHNSLVRGKPDESQIFKFVFAFCLPMLQTN